MQVDFVRLLLLVSMLTVSAVASASAQNRRAKDKTFNPATEEVNAVWIATVGNINWPSKPGLSVQQQQQEAIRILDRSQAIGFNVVVFQARPCGDAFYPSKYFPWSKYLTGTQGKDPGYDPLAFWIAEAHRRGMALHAWINPYRLSTSGGGAQPNFEQFSQQHPVRKHPDWAVSYADDKIYFNPGIPACRKYVVDAALEIVQKYDVDGIHMDDYFYPYPKDQAVFDDARAFRAFSGNFIRSAQLEKKPPKEQLGHWRRHNVNLMVKEIYDGKNRIRPKVLFGVSPFGIWRNLSSDPTGSETRGLQSYDAIYADTKFWIENEIVDYVVPQLYWPIGYEVADYSRLVDWWSRLAKQHPKVKLCIGLAVHRVGGEEGTAWAGSDEIVRQIQMNRQHSIVAGQFYFGWPKIRDNKSAVADQIHRLIKENKSPVRPDRKGASFPSDGRFPGQDSRDFLSESPWKPKNREIKRRFVLTQSGNSANAELPIRFPEINFCPII